MNAIAKFDAMDFHQPFLINQQFLIDPSRHTMHDLKTQSETRMERRHVNLLVQLCSRKGKLLERSFLIQEIWNDYGGGDEALTQGISVLRKILADDKKEMIKTIPKKGYIFQGEISVAQPSLPDRTQPSVQKNARAWLYSTFSVIVVLVVLLIFLRPASKQQQAKPETLGDEKPVIENDKRNEKHTNPPPEGKDDARKTTTGK